ncbi:MAG: hypothetical protein HOY69_09810 [Streptomyces sp.]|nr:hypothetical protein [Streptomyces sp.]
MRAGFAAVAVAVALALSGCGSGGGTKKATASATGQPDSPSVSPSASDVTTASPASPAQTASSTASASPAGTGDPTQTVEGVWLAAEGTTKVQLVLGQGKAGLTSTHLCGGTYTDRNGVAITLTCMDGDMERTRGHGVLAGDGKTLTVQWTNGPTDVFARTGLPSD